MKLLQATPALFMIGLSLLVGFGTLGLTYWDEVTPGPAFFPVWLASAGTFLGVTLLALQFRGLSLGELDFPDRDGFMRVFATLMAMIAIGVLTPVVGMVVSVGLFVSFMLIVVLRQKLLPSLFTAFVVGGGIQLVFVHWLGVSLPSFPLAF